jgi:hypothetical protein
MCGLRRVHPLRSKQTNLRSVAMYDHEAVSCCNLRQLGRRKPHIVLLLLRTHLFATPEQRVSAKSYDDSHNDTPFTRQAWRQELP